MFLTKSSDKDSLQDNGHIAMPNRRNKFINLYLNGIILEQKA